MSSSNEIGNKRKLTLVTETKSNVKKKNEEIKRIWPTFIYLPIPCNSNSQIIINSCLQHFVDHNHIPIHVIEIYYEYHISLSRHLELPYHQIESFHHHFIQSFHSFQSLSIILSSKYFLMTNDRMNRIFVCVSTDDKHMMIRNPSYDSFGRLIHTSNECVKRFRQPVYYDPPIMHISIASLQCEVISKAAMIRWDEFVGDRPDNSMAMIDKYRVFNAPSMVWRYNSGKETVEIISYDQLVWNDSIPMETIMTAVIPNMESSFNHSFKHLDLNCTDKIDDENDDDMSWKRVGMVGSSITAHSSEDCNDPSTIRITLDKIICKIGNKMTEIPNNVQMKT